MKLSKKEVKKWWSENKEEIKDYAKSAAEGFLIGSGVAYWALIAYHGIVFGKRYGKCVKTYVGETGDPVYPIYKKTVHLSRFFGKELPCLYNDTHTLLNREEATKLIAVLTEALEETK